MFLDENTPDLRTIRRRYSELGIADLLNAEGDIIMQPPQLIQDFPEEIRFRLIIPAGGEDDETLDWTPITELAQNRRRLHEPREQQQQQPRRNHAAVGTDDVADDTDDTEADYFIGGSGSVGGGMNDNGAHSGQELVIDEGVVALEPEHYAAGDMYDDYDGDYDYEDDDEDDRYTIDTFDLDDYHLHRANYAGDEVFLQFCPPDSELFDEDDEYDEDDDVEDDEDDRDDDDDEGAEREVANVNNSRHRRNDVTPTWFSSSSSPPCWFCSSPERTDENDSSELVVHNEPEENWESTEPEPEPEPERVPLANIDYEGLVLQQHSQQVEELEEESTPRSVSGGADWPVAELGEDSERTMRLWSSVISLSESDFESESEREREPESDFYCA